MKSFREESEKRFEKRQKRAQLAGAIINMVGSVAAAGAGKRNKQRFKYAGAAARSAGSTLQSTAEGRQRRFSSMPPKEVIILLVDIYRETLVLLH